MINAYSQRFSPPFYGMVQIVESEQARAITMDGRDWEIHFAVTRGPRPDHRSFRRVANVRNSELARVSSRGTHDGHPVDERILELTRFLCNASRPFAATDVYEYWLLDARDDSPLALICSCGNAERMGSFPDRPEWLALPASVMPIESTEKEKSYAAAPVNFRVERLIAERAGSRPKARWFRRHCNEQDEFPALLLREDWDDEDAHTLCQRYITRQATRLLMLQGLHQDDRRRLELASRAHAMEVERFHPMYPEVIDADLMNRIRIEARMRSQTESERSQRPRQEGILYI
jgi:hypothetical protein